MKVTKDMIIMDVLKMDMDTAQFFLNIGMHCLGCPSASGETLEQACMVHGADVDKLVNDINDFLATKEGWLWGYTLIAGVTLLSILMFFILRRFDF